MSSIKQILENWSIPAVVLTWCGVSIWRSSRRLARLAAKESEIRRPDTRELRTNAPFRRADFSAKAGIVRKEKLKGAAIALVLLIVSGPSMIAVSRLAPSFRHALPAYWTILLLLMMGSLLAFAVRGSRLARLSGLICPGCGIDLTSVYAHGRFGYPVQDLVLETGRCPGCKEQLLDPAEVGQVSDDLSPAGHAVRIGLIAVMIAAIVTMTYFGHKQVNANAWHRCRRLYAAAYRASDSVVIDSTRLARNDSVTCEYFRLTHDPEPDPPSVFPQSDLSSNLR